MDFWLEVLAATIAGLVVLGVQLAVSGAGTAASHSASPGASVTVVQIEHHIIE